MTRNGSLAEPIQELPGPILVLGAGGFIGANLFHRLLKDRDDVYGGVKAAPVLRLEGVAAEYVIEVDILAAGDMQRLLDRLRPMTVFDLCAYGAYSFENDIDRIYRTNFDARVSLIELLAERRISAYVHAGSSSEYGLNAAAPPEDSPLVPDSHYAVSKAAMAHMIAFAGKKRGFPCVNLRLYSVYGPYEDSSRLLPNLVEHGLRGVFPPFVNPDTTRDFVYVGDVVEAFVLAARNLRPDIYGESFNIGSGRKTTIREMATVAQSLFNIKMEPVFSTMEKRSWDLQDWYADPSKAENILGWRANTTLVDGLKKTAEWWSSFAKQHTFSTLTKKPMHSGKNSVSAIVAVYKDEPAIPIMYQRLTNTFKRLGVDYEIIFVDDSSPDNATEKIRELSQEDSHVVGICHSRNFGSQAAFRSGMEVASKEACVLLDGDLQDPPELIEQFIEKWREGYDVIYGRRIRREMPFYLGAMYKIFYRIFDKFSYIAIPPDAGDFSLIDRRVIQWLLQFKERDIFLRGLRAYVGFRQTGVDYKRPERLFGRSTNSFLKNLGWAKKGIFSFSSTPLNILSFAGVVLFLISAVLAVIHVLLKLFYPDIAPKGITTVMVSIIFFGSINLLGISVLGEYLGKIIEEVKQRPHFIRQSLIRNGKIIQLPLDE